MIAARAEKTALEQLKEECPAGTGIEVLVRADAIFVGYTKTPNYRGGKATEPGVKLRGYVAFDSDLESGRRVLIAGGWDLKKNFRSFTEGVIAVYEDALLSYNK